MSRLICVPDWQIVHDITILLEFRIDQAEKMRDRLPNGPQHAYYTGKRDAVKEVFEMKEGKSLAEQLIEKANSTLEADND